MQLRLHGLAAAARPTRTTSTAGALRATSAFASTLGATTPCPAADAARAVLGTSIACTGCGTTAAAATAAGVAAPDRLRRGICSHLPWRWRSAGRPQSHGRTLPCSCDCMAWQRQRALPVSPQRLAPLEPRPRPLVPSDLRLPAPPPTQRAPSSEPRSHAPAAAPPLLLRPLPALRPRSPPLWDLQPPALAVA